ncbi:MAG: hypothetical protein KYX63_03710 [Alteromonas macleodii]|nr:hypothetical protein [Alteromonas macleodii]
MPKPDFYWNVGLINRLHNKSNIDVPSKMQIRAMFYTCSSHQIAYYETQDFVR